MVFSCAPVHSENVLAEAVAAVSNPPLLRRPATLSPAGDQKDSSRSSSTLSATSSAVERDAELAKVGVVDEDGNDDDDVH